MFSSAFSLRYFFSINWRTLVCMKWVSTIQGNRLQGAPLNKKAILQKETWGTFDYILGGNNFLVAWADNKVVAKSSFINKVLVENWEKPCRVINAKSFQGVQCQYGRFWFIWPVRVNLLCANPFQKVAVAIFRLVNKCNCCDFLRFFRKIHGNNIPLVKCIRELVFEDLGKYGSMDQCNFWTPLE